MIDLNFLKNMATQVRRDSLRMVNASKSGHPGGSLSCADFLVGLYFNSMTCVPSNFTLKGENEDVFYLSNGHVCPAWYSVLARKGYFPISELATLRQYGSRLQGHPSIKHNLPGIRSASGSLGQGLSVAIGHALAKKSENDNHIAYVLLGDGELQEGQVWEAAMYAGSKHVDNLIAAIDCNGLQIDGTTDMVNSLGNVAEKFIAFGWQVLSVDKGNDMHSIVNAIDEAKSLLFNNKPIVLILHTQMGFGISFMQNDNKWHGNALDDSQLKDALSQLIIEKLQDY